MNRVEIRFDGVKEQSWQERVPPFINAVLQKLGHDRWDLSLLFCGNLRIRSLNARYRNRDEPTDVLSFTLGETAGGRFLPGDIAVSLDMVKENAEYFRVSPDEELRRLLIHGILHLGGMDHASNDRSEPMLALQEKVLQECSGIYILDKEKW